MNKAINWIGRAAVLSMVVATLAILAGGAAQAATVVSAAGVNPFTDIVPNFEVFGVEFNNTWKKLLSGFWALAFVVVAFGALRNALELQRAKKGNYPPSVAENSEALKMSGYALGVLTGIGVIFGAIIALF